MHIWNLEWVMAKHMLTFGIWKWNDIWVPNIWEWECLSRFPGLGLGMGMKNSVPSQLWKELT